MIAIARRRPPGLDDLKAVLDSPKAHVAAAAGLFAACAAAVVMLLGPASGKPIRIHLSSVFDQAPKGWREALSPASVAWLSEEVLHLSDGRPGVAAGGQAVGPTTAGAAEGALPPA